jgi:hypothetical protein
MIVAHSPITFKKFSNPTILPLSVMTGWRVPIFSNDPLSHRVTGLPSAAPKESQVRAKTLQRFTFSLNPEQGLNEIINGSTISKRSGTVTSTLVGWISF